MSSVPVIPLKVGPDFTGGDSFRKSRNQDSLHSFCNTLLVMLALSRCPMSHPLYEHLLAVSEELLCAHRVSSTYANSSGKGDMRETALRDWLGEFLSARLSVSKGEIVDSSGRRSREFDCVIHLPSLALRIFGRAGRRIVPVEEVLIVLEIKSNLKPNDIQVFSDALLDLATFERHYEPSEVFKAFAGASHGTVQPFCVRGSECDQAIPAIHGAMFAYEGASDATIAAYPAKASSPMLACVHVLQRAFWVQTSPGQWASPHCQGNSFPAFAAFLLTATADEKDRWTFVRPEVRRYVEPVVRDVDQQVGVPRP